jgi:hypothetical protein
MCRANAVFNSGCDATLARTANPTAEERANTTYWNRTTNKFFIDPDTYDFAGSTKMAFQVGMWLPSQLQPIQLLFKFLLGIHHHAQRNIRVRSYSLEWLERFEQIERLLDFPVLIYDLENKSIQLYAINHAVAMPKLTASFLSSSNSAASTFPFSVCLCMNFPNSDIVDIAFGLSLLLAGVTLPPGALSSLNLSFASRAYASSLALKASYFF